MKREQTESTKVMMWRAVRVAPPKVPQTLADCEEWRYAVCFLDGDCELLIRDHTNGKVRSSCGRIVGHCPSDYTFIRYLEDTQPEEKPVPATFGELRDGQCCECMGRRGWRVSTSFTWVSTSGNIGIIHTMHDTPITFIPDIEMVLEEQPQ